MEFPNEAYDHEKPEAVFKSLLDTLDMGLTMNQAWLQRWNEAKSAEYTMAAYNREYDRSLATITWGGQ